jgi:type I restriction-modification system DNA methylase subunit
MNFAIWGIEANLGRHPVDTFHQDLHPDLKADYIFANQLFNMSDWGGERLQEDKVHHLAPAGVAITCQPDEKDNKRPKVGLRDEYCLSREVLCA